MRLDDQFGRVVHRCDTCRLVQFETGRKQCRRCKTLFSPAPKASPVETVDETFHFARALEANQRGLDIGSTVRLLRNVLGYSQRNLAHDSKMVRTYISKIENGKCEPKVTQLERIARIFGLNMAGMLELCRTA